LINVLYAAKNSKNENGFLVKKIIFIKILKMDKSFDSISTLSSELYFIYKNRIAIAVGILVFSVIGYFVVENKTNDKNTEYRTTSTFASPAIQNEIFVTLCNSISSMSALEKSRNLHVSISLANSIKSVSASSKNIQGIITDQIQKTVIELHVSHLNKKNGDLLIEKIISYLNANDFVKDKFEKFAAIQVKKRALLNNINTELAKIEKYSFELENYEDYGVVSNSALELVKLKMRWEADVLDSAKIDVVTTGFSELANPSTNKVMMILPYALFGFAISIVSIYFLAFIKKIKSHER
jgi:hypothetical protein